MCHLTKKKRKNKLKKGTYPSPQKRKEKKKGTYPWLFR